MEFNIPGTPNLNKYERAGNFLVEWRIKTQEIYRQKGRKNVPKILCAEEIGVLMYQVICRHKSVRSKHGKYSVKKEGKMHLRSSIVEKLVHPSHTILRLQSTWYMGTTNIRYWGIDSVLVSSSQETTKEVRSHTVKLPHVIEFRYASL